jgi:hypothetical protein
MTKGKALGPDGFPIELFQEFWEVIKLSLLEVVRNFESLQKTKMLRVMNATILSLIPKWEGPNSLDLFRPITLCSVVYRVITKLIVEHLKLWLNGLISEERGIFVVSR